MATIKPFRGIFYNLSKIRNLTNILTPPYDIISPEEQEKYLKGSPYNFLHLDLPKDYLNDTPDNNKYTRAAVTFNDWQKKGVLVRDEKPAFYLLEQAYEINTIKHRRKGLILLVKLEEFKEGAILPHERTFLGPRTDRLNMLRACNANLSQIFGLYSDPKGSINANLLLKAKTLPELEVKTNDGIINRLWKIYDEKMIDEIVETLKDKNIFIADGHHRYETALIYRNEIRKLSKKPSEEKPYDYVSMFLVDMDNEEMTILPVHRLIKNIPRFQPLILQRELMEYFDIEVFTFNSLFNEMKKREDRTTFGLYLGEKRPYLLTLKDKNNIYALLDEKHSKNWKEFDVSILHDLIIERILGINRKKIETEDCIKFTIDEKEAVELVDRDDYQIAFFVNSTKIEQLKKIAMNRETMPQKSTYFHPKLPSGLVINKLEW